MALTLPDGYHAVPRGKLANVVTHLEMLAPAPPLAERGDADWRLRRVPEPHVDWYRDLYVRVGSPWLWAGRLALDEAGLAAILADPRLEVSALEVDGRDEGILELDFRVEGECELTYFGVTERLIGSGAAAYLMNRALERVWPSGVGRFWVHTCTLDHPRAGAFYRRAGFVPFKYEVEVLDDPRVTGALPRDCAPHVPLFDVGGS
jgi:GNAT superfamily N-acetyltransferase